MSRGVRDWAWGIIPSLRSAEQSVILLYLAERADETGYCFPSRQQIAKGVNITERSITRALNFFEDMGWLHREAGKGAGNKSQYKFTFKNGIEETGKGDIENSVNRKPGKGETVKRGKGEKVTQETGKGDIENGEKVTQEAFPPHPPIMSNRHVTVNKPSEFAQSASEQAQASPETDHALSPETELPVEPPIEPEVLQDGRGTGAMAANGQLIGAQHPSIKAVRSMCGLYPDKAIWGKIATALGDLPDYDKLSECYQEWVARGFKKTNYAWVLDWYAKGIPPQKGAQNGGYTNPSGTSVASRIECDSF